MNELNKEVLFRNLKREIMILETEKGIIDTINLEKFSSEIHKDEHIFVVYNHIIGDIEKINRRLKSKIELLKIRETSHLVFKITSDEKNIYQSLIETYLKEKEDVIESYENIMNTFVKIIAHRYILRFSEKK